MTRDEARQWAERAREQSAEVYNTLNFPILVAHHGNWDIYRDANGRCAAIPVVQGCRASHFGTMDYLKHVPHLVYVDQVPTAAPDTTPSDMQEHRLQITAQHSDDL